MATSQRDRGSNQAPKPPTPLLERGGFWLGLLTFGGFVVLMFYARERSFGFWCGIAYGLGKLVEAIAGYLGEQDRYNDWISKPDRDLEARERDIARRKTGATR